MSDQKDVMDSELEEVPFLQKLYDRPIVLLLAGLVVMFGFYTIWGVWEMMTLPQAPLP